jgi:hypothetical protein
MYTRKTLVKTNGQCWGVISIFLISSNSDFWEIWRSKEPLAPVYKKFWNQRWVLFFWKFENQKMSGFDLLNSFRTSRSSFAKKPQRTKGYHKIIISFTERYPTNSEIFWELWLYMRISSQILRTIVVYQKLVIWIFANHGYIPETPLRTASYHFPFLTATQHW